MLGRWIHVVIAASLAGEPHATTAATSATSRAHEAGVRVDVVMLGDAAPSTTPEIPQALTDALIERLRAEGLDAALVDAACTTTSCVADQVAARSDGFLVVFGVHRDDRDYQTSLRIFERSTGEDLGETQRDCTICGAAEVADVVDEQAGRLAARLLQLAQAAPVSIASDPSGIEVEVDGRAVGTTPMHLRLAAGPHDVVLRAPARVPARRRIHVTPGFAESLTVRVPAVAPPRAVAPRVRVDPRMLRREASMRVAGGVSLAIGVLALGALIPLFVLDGHPVASRCGGLDRDFLGNCHYVHATQAGAIGASAVSAVGLIGGSTLFGLAVARARSRRARERASARQ